MDELATVVEVEETETAPLMVQIDGVDVPLDKIQETIEAKVTAEVTKRLAGVTPKASTADPTAPERAEFLKMSYKDRLKVFNSNPTAYKKLIGGIQ